MSSSQVVPQPPPSPADFSHPAGEEERDASPIPEAGIDASGKRIIRSVEEIDRRHERAREALRKLDEIGDEEDHRETMTLLRHALGEGRTLSNRKLF